MWRFDDESVEVLGAGDRGEILEGERGVVLLAGASVLPSFLPYCVAARASVSLQSYMLPKIGKGELYI